MNMFLKRINASPLLISFSKERNLIRILLTSPKIIKFKNSKANRPF